MGHWMTDVNGDDYYVEDKGHWTTDVNGDDHYIKEKDDGKTLVYFGNNDCVRVQNSLEDIMSAISKGFKWIYVKEASTKSIFAVQVKTILYITDYESWIE